MLTVTGGDAKLKNMNDSSPVAMNAVYVLHMGKRRLVRYLRLLVRNVLPR